MAIKHQNKFRLYKFYLRHASYGTLELYSAPKGWKDDGFTFSRSTRYFGMFRSRSSQVLSFAKEGKRFLNKILQADGIEGSCDFIVYKYNFNTYSYDLNFEGVIDFSTKRNSRTMFECKAVDSSFEKKIRNRDDIAVRLFDLFSIDGYAIQGFTNEGVQITLPQVISYKYNGLLGNNTTNGLSTLAALISIAYSEDEHVKNSTSETDISGTDGAFIIAASDIETVVSGQFYANMVNITGVDIITISIKHYNGSGVLQNTYILYSETVEISDEFEIDFEQSVSMSTNDYLILLIKFGSLITSIDEVLYSVSLGVKTSYSSYPESIIYTFMRFEAFARVLQSITDKQDPLRSSVLGRIDSEPYQYGSDGAKSLGCVTNGKLIRAFPKEGNPLSCSLYDLFKSISVIDYLGLGVETISNDRKVVIEDVDYFFDERIILTIENAKDINTEFATDFIYNKIIAGYNKLAYEQKDGVFEYNNKSEYSTFIKSVKNELDLVSKYRADNAGINFARLKLYSQYPTEDTQFDEDNFMIDLYRNSNLILNGRFNDWTAGNPDNWTEYHVDVAEKTYLSNSRLQVIQITSPFIAGGIKQSVSVTTGDLLFLSFVYKFISEVDLNGQAALVVTIGGYSLKSDGSWDATGLSSIPFAINVPSVKESELNSFDDFNIIMDSCPATGTMEVYLSTLTVGFTVDNVILNAGGYMIARTNEEFDNISGTIDNDKSFNILYSPGRMVRNWGSWIRAGLDKYDGSYVVYNRSDKNSSLRSTVTGENEVAESENILVADLNEPRFEPEYITFNAPITNEMISIINDNWSSDGKPKMYGIIKVKEELTDDYYYGWIVEVKSEGVDKNVPFRLLKVNTNKLTPL